MVQMAYISHSHEDRAIRDRIVEWARQGELGADWSIPPTGDDGAREGKARGSLSTHVLGAAAVILLVGNTTHGREAIDLEINHALTQRKKLVVVRVPGTSAQVPKGAQHLPVTDLRPQAIRAALGTR